MGGGGRGGVNSDVGHFSSLGGMYTLGGSQVHVHTLQ